MQRGIREKLMQIVRTVGVQNLYEDDINIKLRAAFGVMRECGPMGKSYPNRSIKGFCDLVIPHDDGRVVWIEVKVAQTYFSQTQFGRDNRHLFKKYMGHECTKDVTYKLTSLLNHKETAAVGFLLILLYSDRFPLPSNAITNFKKNTGLDGPLWKEYKEAEWVNPNHADLGSYLAAYYWEREPAALQI